jgi:hypothetical protein
MYCDLSCARACVCYNMIIYINNVSTIVIVRTNNNVSLVNHVFFFFFFFVLQIAIINRWNLNLFRKNKTRGGAFVLRIESSIIIFETLAHDVSVHIDRTVK